MNGAELSEGLLMQTLLAGHCNTFEFRCYAGCHRTKDLTSSSTLHDTADVTRVVLVSSVGNVLVWGKAYIYPYAMLTPFLYVACPR